MKNATNMLKIISIIMGTLIGAGFASGKEIYIFFMIYGKLGYLGITISGILTAIIIYYVMKIVKKHDIKNNSEFIEKLTDFSNKRVKRKITLLLKSIINIFLIISFFIMIAGCSAYFKQELSVPIFISAAIMSIVLYCTFMKNIEGIIKLNSIIVPILLLIIIYISISCITTPAILISRNNINLQQNYSVTLLVKSIISGILYSSYNSIILIPIIISLNRYVKDKKTFFLTLTIITIMFIVLAIGICRILNCADFNISNVELPIIQILSTKPMQKLMYSIVVVIAIFTSAVSAGYGILENIKNKILYKKIALVLCAVGVAVSYIGFGNLVGILYPVFGCIGVLQIVLIFVTI